MSRNQKGVDSLIETLGKALDSALFCVDTDASPKEPLEIAEKTLEALRLVLGRKS